MTEGEFTDAPPPYTRPPDDPPAIALLGATGRTGAWVGLRALRRGYRVQALRRPSSLDPLEGKPITMIEGDVQNPDHLDSVVAGACAVLVTLGQRPPYTDVFCEAATAAILVSMDRQRVSRVIAVTGAMIGEMDQGQTALLKRTARMFAEWQLAAAADRAGQERALLESDVDWTIVKPPRLTEAPRRHRVKSGTRLKVGVLSRVSRPDLAEFMLDQIDSTEYVRQRVLVKA